MVLKILGKEFMEVIHSFDKLRWYFEETQRVNPKSHLVFDVNLLMKRFRQCFMSFVASINSFQYIRSMIFLDGTFLKG